jgi:brefeldin A-inhibited guanine nucleotide-exchange protein
LHHQGSSSDVAGKIVDAFDRKRTAEQNFELGSVKFTLSLKLGLNFFVDNGFVTLDAKEIAVFFIQNKDKLDKTQMGEVLGREPDAPFLKVPKDLDPEKGGRGFFVRILHHYADSMEFTGIMFDDAIRLFLSGFRLPGEAQKIDRIMEKFAQRFTEQNLDVFPSADTAFILAFSVIMLNTDLHNPSIKPERRMTQAGFVRNNKGIGDNGADLPEDFLIGIFERIKAGPFSLKEDDAAREAVAVVESSLFFDTGGSFFRTSAEERRKEKFKKEREDMVAATEQLIRGRSKKVQTSGAATSTSKLTEAVAPADVVKPMFDVTWGPMIGILSQILECSNDERSIAVCLNGFVYAIRLAAHSNMSLARETFVNSLAKFTYLGSIKEMKRKNIESIRTLLSIAVIDGEYLGESWGPVLQCISQLSRMRMSASGLDSDESFLQDESNDEGGKKAPTPRIDVLPDGGGLFRHPTRAEITKETEDNNGRAILAAVNEVLIDKVFSSTVKLSSRSLAHFIEQLVAVSNSEIDGDSKSGITGVAAQSSGKKGTGSAHGDEGPSIFCLQKLVEVADYNMDVRPRLAWTKIWGIMAAYFAKIGCHKNAMVSFFAIDSLKQLSNKFLEKPELSEYNFQRIFLKPFLEIMETPGTREDTRQLILQCVDNTTRTKSHNIQSGWKIFFSILTVSASDPSEKITFYGLNILQRFLDEHLDQICRLSEVEEGGVGHEEENTESLTALERRNRNSNAEDFIEMCRASLSFVQTKESDSPRAVGSSMRAICHTAIFADLLAQHRVKPPVSGAQVTDPDAPGFTYEGLDETEELEMVLWRPIFEGLAEGIRCTAISQAGGVGNMVQRGSILALRAILLRHGSAFTINQLSAVLQQTILPSMQRAVESDHSPVVSITSESPTVSSLDFLTDAMPLPPPPTDPGLMKFQEVANGL